MRGGCLLFLKVKSLGNSVVGDHEGNTVSTTKSKGSSDLLIGWVLYMFPMLVVPKMYFKK